MKLLGLLLIAFATVCGTYANLNCNTDAENVKDANWDMVASCTDLLRAQVQMEMGAAMTYLAMGAHFSEDRINRPGFSKFFFDAANEEREHAIKVIEYLLMRGQLTLGAGELLPYPVKNVTVSWIDGLTALQEALKLEVKVTKSIRKIIRVCEGEEVPKDSTDATKAGAKSASSQNKSPSKHDKMNDYHLVDYFTSDFLDEQYKGERDLAGKISTLLKMTGTDNPDKSLGEFLFDKKLLHGEL